MKRSPWKLSPLFSPHSIAVIGASPKGGAGSIVIRNLQRLGFAGTIHPVNPKYADVLGYPCHPSLETIPGPVDCAAVLLGDKAILPILKTAHARGVKGVWAFASGFAETGEQGAAMQREIRDFCRETGLLFCGPNCVGYANITDGVGMDEHRVGRHSGTANITDGVGMYSAPLPRAFRKGSIGVIAQSGAVLLALGNSPREAGFSRLISSGNEAALGLADYMDYLVDDPKTAVIALFVETIRDPEGVADACRRARGAGKPVIALKVGRSELACLVAATHTGAIAGSDRTLDAFFRRWHVIRVNTLDELLETSILFSGLRGAPTTSRRVGMSTVSGGEMGMLADICSDYGLEFPPLSEEGKAGLRNVLPPYAPLANPLDAWGSGDLKEAYPASLSILAREPAVDLLIVSQDMPSNMADEQIAQFSDVAAAAVRARADSGKPVVVVSNISGGIDPSIRKILDDGGVPALQGSTEGVGAVAAWLDWNRALPEETDPPLPLPTDLLAELDTCGGIVPYALSTRVLAHFGITALCERLTQTPEEAKAAAEAIGYPVALKGISPDITHKTETGLVKLNIADAGALRQAWDELERSMNLHHPDARREGMLIQSMVTDDVVETIAGVNRDPAFGSAVVVGLGGIFVELLRDVSLELAPLSPARAKAMINRLQAAKLLQGFRGKQPADIAALKETLVRLGRMAHALGERLISLELNPLMVLPEGQGVRIVDIVMQARPSGDSPKHLP